MPTKAQLQKNADDVTNAYDRYRDTMEKHFPRRHAAITDYTAIISTKRGY